MLNRDPVFFYVSSTVVVIFPMKKVNMGGTIPKSYYFSNQPKSESVNGKSLAVPNRSKQQLEFQVSIPGSTLR